MGLEYLAIPESKISEVIRVIRTGLASEACESISSETRKNLRKWCNDQEEYQKRES